MTNQQSHAQLKHHHWGEANFQPCSRVPFCLRWQRQILTSSKLMDQLDVLVYKWC